MTQYELWNRMCNYSGGFGHGDKKAICDIKKDRFDQEMMPTKTMYNKLNDYSSQYVTSMGLQTRIKRDMAIDAMNPQEKIPEDLVSAQMIDVVPPFAWSHPPDFSTPQDNELNDNVKLVQQAFLNAEKQSKLYEDPDSMKNEKYNTDKVGKGNEGMKQEQFYSMDGSAAGQISNRLASEQSDEDYRKNSVETMTAF